MTQNILFDQSTFDEFKCLYRKAVKNGDESFIFRSEVILTSFAKYLIEWLEVEMNNT